MEGGDRWSLKDYDFSPGSTDYDMVHVGTILKDYCRIGRLCYFARGPTVTERATQRKSSDFARVFQNCANVLSDGRDVKMKR